MKFIRLGFHKEQLASRTPSMATLVLQRLFHQLQPLKPTHGTRLSRPNTATWKEDIIIISNRSSGTNQYDDVVGVNNFVVASEEGLVRFRAIS